MRYQKPGLTANNNERIFVTHNYHDHAGELEDRSASKTQFAPFPVKLHSVLNQVARDGADDVISWQPHGRSFLIHKPKEFVATVMPKYFKQTKITSFQRQLCLYGFLRLTTGQDCGAYYSEYFLRGKPWMAKLHMRRTRIKGTGYKAASNPESEPNLYTFPFVTVATAVAIADTPASAYAASIATSHPPMAPYSTTTPRIFNAAASMTAPQYKRHCFEELPLKNSSEEDRKIAPRATIAMNRSEMMMSESACMEIDMRFLTADPVSDFFAATAAAAARTESEAISLGSECSSCSDDSEYIAIDMENVTTTEFRINNSNGYPGKAIAFANSNNFCRSESEVSISIGDEEKKKNNNTSNRFSSLDNFDIDDLDADDDPEITAVLQGLMADSFVI